MGAIDIAGKTYNRLTVIKRVANNKYGDAMWECKCSCGSITVVLGSSLRRGHVKSCGCLAKEIHKKEKYKHGLSKTRLYKIFHAMKSRCLNKNNQEYCFYGGKGVTICEEWINDFNKFYEWAYSHGYNDSLTIDRIDNNKGYSPDNCQWSTRAEQNRNTSRINFVSGGGNKPLTTAQVAEIIGVTRSTAAKWYREEHLRTLADFKNRALHIVKYNYKRTIGYKLSNSKKVQVKSKVR